MKKCVAVKSAENSGVMLW